MNRRNFFAFIPAISAIPLVGKEIIQEEKNVTIIQPEPVKIEQQPSTISLNDLEVHVIDRRTGREVAIGWVTELNCTSPMYHASQVDIHAQLMKFDPYL
jgi:hypothetical protein